MRCGMDIFTGIGRLYLQLVSAASLDFVGVTFYQFHVLTFSAFDPSSNHGQQQRGIVYLFYHSLYHHSISADWRHPFDLQYVRKIYGSSFRAIRRLQNTTIRLRIDCHIFPFISIFRVYYQYSLPIVNSVSNLILYDRFLYLW